MSGVDLNMYLVSGSKIKSRLDKEQEQARKKLGRCSKHPDYWLFDGCPVCQKEKRIAHEKKRQAELREMREKNIDKLVEKYGAPKKENKLAILENYQQAQIEYSKRYAKKPYDLILYGSTGTGKTVLSVFLMKMLIIEGWKTQYINAVNLARDIRKAFICSERKGKSINPYEICENLIEPDVLVIDDMGTGTITGMILEEFYHLISSRISEIKTTIVTTNLLSYDEIETIYGAKIASRIWGFKRIETTGSDRRKK